MSPEALDEAKFYTHKLDIFSFGLILIQILTRQFPNPTDRFRIVHVPQFDEEVVVPDSERRQIRLIPDTHTLKPLALQCLKKKDSQRPSALQLNESLSEMKQAPQYTESLHQAQSCSGYSGGEETDALRTQELQQQYTHKDQQIEQLVAHNQQLEQQLRDQTVLTETKTREAGEHLAHNTQLQNMVEEYQRTIVTKDRQLQEKQQMIEAKQRQIQEHQYTIATKQRQLQQRQEQLQASERLVAEFQQSPQQQDNASRIPPQQLPVSVNIHQGTEAASAAQKDISGGREIMYRCQCIEEQ